MKKFLILASLLLCLISISSCTQNNSEKQDNRFTFTDDSGYRVFLSQKPEKVAVLFSSYAEMVLLSGGTVDVTVGEAVERGFSEVGTPLVDDGAGKQINTELLIAENPDLVIGSLDISAHKETAELMRSAGIPTALFHVESFSDYERVMKILCDIFENAKMYAQNVVRVREETEKILKGIPKGEKKKILFVRCASSAGATKAKTGKDNFVCAMLDEMNTCNIAENAPVLLDGLSIEEIILQNPEYIFFSTMGDEKAAREYMTGVLQSDEWQTLDAVRNEKYTFLDKELFQYKPNNRWHIAYKTLAELLYGKE